MSNHRLIGSKGYALGGSRAEPWALLPSLVPPGPETDMRSLRQVGCREAVRVMANRAPEWL
jgi:hypothetical protein